jgi:hypothetical protein
MDPERGSNEGLGWPQDLPPPSDIERLLAIYVATGEGQGAYMAAKTSEEEARGPNPLRPRRLITGTGPITPDSDEINLTERVI